MESYDIDERIKRLERRYGATSSSLTSYRQEFEVLSRVPWQSSARLAHLAQKIDRLSRARRHFIEQLSELETQGA